MQTKGQEKDLKSPGKPWTQERQEQDSRCSSPEGKPGGCRQWVHPHQGQPSSLPLGMGIPHPPSGLSHWSALPACTSSPLIPWTPLIQCRWDFLLPGGQSPSRYHILPLCILFETACWYLGVCCLPVLWEEVDSSHLCFFFFHLGRQLLLA